MTFNSWFKPSIITNTAYSSHPSVLHSVFLLHSNVWVNQDQPDFASQSYHTSTSTFIDLYSSDLFPDNTDTIQGISLFNQSFDIRWYILHTCSWSLFITIFNWGTPCIEIVSTHTYFLPINRCQYVLDILNRCPPNWSSNRLPLIRWLFRKDHMRELLIPWSLFPYLLKLQTPHRCVNYPSTRILVLCKCPSINIAGNHVDRWLRNF